MKTLVDPPSKSLSDALDVHLQHCKPVLNLVNDTLFVFLTPGLQIKWINKVVKSYYPLLINKMLEKNLFEMRDISESFNVIEKKLTELNKISLPRICFETKERGRPGETVQWVASYLKNQKGSPIGIALVGKVYKEDANQEKVDYLKNCLDTIVDNIPGSVYWKNKQGIYLGCNSALVRKAKLTSKEEVIGKTDNELWPDYAEELCQRDEEVMALNKTVESQEIIKLNADESSYFLSMKTPLTDQQNNVIGVVGNSLDISEIVFARQKAEQANNIKSQFLLNMQHDIKTPISHIIGLTDILRTSEEIPNKLKEYLNHIHVSSKSLMNLITDILHFSDIESEETPKREWRFNLKEMIQKTIDLNIIAIQEKNLKIIIEYDNDNAMSYNLIGDRDRLSRIILNLFGNALKFTDKGSIKITTKIVKVLVNGKIILELSVEDTGIFDRFTRLTSSSCNQYPGFGLGLSIVKKFIGEMDGEISVSSQVGVGSKFRCVFPCKTTLLETLD
jgi:two-component system aerobic respiration control sensor histidine kinase ArcB